MDYTEKIIWTLLFGFGGFIALILYNKANKELKRRVERQNPDLLQNHSWFFSDTKVKLIKTIILVMLISWIIIICTTDIKIN